MDKILLLTTGGTIASSATEDGLAPSIKSYDIFQLVSFVAEDYLVSTKDILRLDSSNIQPEEWQYIAEQIYENCDDYDGIVVTHGTDTMAYTASILSFMLRGIHIPVVLTGSQLPITHPLTDAIENLRVAFAMAASKTPGIFVAFNRKVILGSRAVKVRTSGFDAFESVNCPYVAQVNSNGLNINRDILPSCPVPFELNTKLCKDVFLIKLTPGFNPQIFDMLLEMNYRGIIVEAFGAGGLHFIRRDLISKLEKMVERGITVVVCSQCLYERSDFTIYQTGKLALEKGVIEGFDMTTEAAVTKLMWVLGQTDDHRIIKEYFGKNIVGEVKI